MRLSTFIVFTLAVACFAESDVSKRLSRLEASVTQLQTNVQRMLQHKQMNSKTGGVPATHLEDPVYVCGGETATLSCNSTTVIELETAEYGSHVDNCATCCDPQAADCSQNMAQTNFDEWNVLNTGCDGVNTCTYTFTSQNIPFCGINTTADYLQIFYSCTTAPTQTQEFIGFTAFAGTNQIGSGLVSFSEIITNEGNHYSPLTSSFTCPQTGFYFFFINVQLIMDSSLNYDICYLYIRQDGVNIALAENDDEVSTTDIEIMMSTSVVTECTAGSVITVESTQTSCYVYGSSSTPWSNFGGYYVGA